MKKDFLIFFLINSICKINNNINRAQSYKGARYSYVVRAFAHGALGHWIDPSWSYLSFQPLHHDWFNKSCGMCYPVCGMMHIKEPLLLIGKSSHMAAAAFILLSEWSSTICSTPHSRK